MDVCYAVCKPTANNCSLRQPTEGEEVFGEGDGDGILQSDLVAGQLTAVLFLRLREWPSRGQVHIAQRRRGADKARLGTTHLEADAQGPSLHLSDLKSARFRQCPYINMPPLLLCARCISCRWIKNDELSKFGKLITAHNGENHLI